MNSLEFISFLIFMRSMFCDCKIEPNSSGFNSNKREYKISKVGKMPKTLRESSGIIPIEDENGIFYTHNDSGGDNKLFKVDLTGFLLDEIIIPDASNKDWEDLTKDDKGNIYIGDFGNNFHKRKDLKIYKYNPAMNSTDTIFFSYGDQQEFPPSSKKEKNYDCEGFFWLDESLYLFSKNWGEKCVKLYKLPDEAGSYTTEPIESFFLNGMVTSADISPNGSKMALLSYGKIYLFNIKNSEPLFSQPYKCINFRRSGQAEALTFINNEDILITNELGRMFLLQRRVRKTKQKP